MQHQHHRTGVAPDLKVGPTREPRKERPDNGSLSSKGSGPSSGVRKDNPHRPLKVVRHAH